MSNFGSEYWKENYSEPETMDGIGNVSDHIRYLDAVIKIDHIDISSVIDLGAGLGVMFQRVLKKYIPYRAHAIEPSEFAFQKLQKKKLSPVDSTKLKVEQKTIQQWCDEVETKKHRFDLAICMSVLQYVDDKDIQLIMPTLAKRCKYIYLTVPTDIELKQQVDNLAFNDRYAIARDRAFYHKILGEHFTFISSRFLESKYYFNENTTLFSDQLFRF